MLPLFPHPYKTTFMIVCTFLLFFQNIYMVRYPYPYFRAVVLAVFMLMRKNCGNLDMACLSSESNYSELLFIVTWFSLIFLLLFHHSILRQPQTTTPLPHASPSPANRDHRCARQVPRQGNSPHLSLRLSPMEPRALSPPLGHYLQTTISPPLLPYSSIHTSLGTLRDQGRRDIGDQDPLRAPADTHV